MNSIRIERTFPLEQFANLKVMLESSVGFDGDVSEESRIAMRLILLAEIEQAYYEYMKMIKSFNINKFSSADAVIEALGEFRKQLYERLRVQSQVKSDDGGTDQ